MRRSASQFWHWFGDYSHRFPNADFVLRHQSVDAAHAILETAIGERSCKQDIAQVVVEDLPDSPAESGYLELPRLPDFIAFFKRRHQSK